MCLWWKWWRRKHWDPRYCNTASLKVHVDEVHVKCGGGGGDGARLTSVHVFQIVQYRQEVHELDEGNFVDVHQKVMYLCLLLENVCMYLWMSLNSKRSNIYLMFIWRTYAFSCTDLHVTNWAWTLLLFVGRRRLAVFVHYWYS